MAEWPDREHLLRVIDVQELDTGDPLDEVLGNVLDSAIARVKQDVGNWDDMVDYPDANLSQAALRMAELLSLRPESAIGSITDPTYDRLLKGYRRRFGFA